MERTANIINIISIRFFSRSGFCRCNSLLLLWMDPPVASQPASILGQVVGCGGKVHSQIWLCRPIRPSTIFTHCELFAPWLRLLGTSNAKGYPSWCILLVTRLNKSACNWPDIIASSRSIGLNQSEEQRFAMHSDLFLSVCSIVDSKCTATNGRGGWSLSFRTPPTRS